KPDFRWNIRELAKTSNVSVGLVARITGCLKKFGVIETGGLGRNGFILLKKPEQLLELWTNQYDFSLNRVKSFYSPDKNSLNKITAFFKKRSIKYALTLHSGANFITEYFSYPDVHIYTAAKLSQETMLNLSSLMEIKKLASGGNIHIVEPYYRNAVFNRTQLIKNVSVVSKLQLYLDLCNFIPRGSEHAKALYDVLKGEIYD
ncbi:MAG: hypothetical protein HYY43_04925, partial [Deltaproteobacteria bacterium]|nr:hypothetical protein [Deltaproteobacteria bacterium]